LINNRICITSWVRTLKAGKCLRICWSNRGVQLANELDRLEQSGNGGTSRRFSVVFTPMRLLESAALVAMGLALGVYVSQQQAPGPIATTAGTPTVVTPFRQTVTVSNLRIVNADTTTGNVELAGEVVQPLRLSGKMEDER
jgi:hypothetical protein